MTSLSTTEPALAVSGRLATIWLRRPAAINAFTPADIAAVTGLLRAAVADPAVETILFRGEGERGFCAGGDIKLVRDLIAAGDLHVLAGFWASEYRLAQLIATCPKPVVSIAHGLTLGGGMGLASHASHRIVTESSRLGMPEVLIGLSPDIGGLWLYANAPGRTGIYAALTAAQLGPGDAIHLGLADAYVRDEDLDDVVARLQRIAPSDALADYTSRPPSWVAEHRDTLDETFGADSIHEIAERVARGGPGSAEFTGASPTALAVTHEGLKRAARMTDLTQCLAQDLVVSQHCARHPDLAEGIRARVVDKDRSPRWQPPTLDAVTDADVAGFFEPAYAPLEFDSWA